MSQQQQQQQAEVRHRKGGDAVFDEDDDVEDDEDDAVPRIVKQLDFNPKLKRTAEKSSARGGLVTVVAIAITLWLLHAEFQSYSTPYQRDTVYVDTSREHPDVLIKVYVDIEFQYIPCAALSLDVVDKDGDQLPNARAHMVRTRVVTDGERRDVVGHLENNVMGTAAVTKKEWVPPQDYCGSCYDVANLPNHRTTCCNTCTDLKRAYISHGLDPRVAANSEQCLRAMDSAHRSFGQNEGCRIHGHLEIPPSNGNFHVAAGKPVTADHESHKHHVHALTAEELLQFNSTHLIRQLSFGRPYPEFVYPLAQQSWLDRKLSQVKYMINVVPVKFEGFADRADSFLYSATRHNIEVDFSQPHFPPPGVYFLYDFSAFEIKHSLVHNSFLHFLTRVCALVGGMFVIIGLVYRLIDAALTAALGEERSSSINSLL